MKPKSQSKKIRDIIYRIWQQTDKKMTDEEYYQMRTVGIINELMKELEPPIESYDK
ncbi:MAG TPA: hypothetical protein VF941_03060 [Clostridia bacterium]